VANQVSRIPLGFASSLDSFRCPLFPFVIRTSWQRQGLADEWKYGWRIFPRGKDRTTPFQYNYGTDRECTVVSLARSTSYLSNDCPVVARLDPNPSPERQAVSQRSPFDNPEFNSSRTIMNQFSTGQLSAQFGLAASIYGNDGSLHGQYKRKWTSPCTVRSVWLMPY
jgi:hypothetical protein